MWSMWFATRCVYLCNMIVKKYRSIVWCDENTIFDVFLKAGALEMLLNNSVFGCCCSVRLVGTICRFKIDFSFLPGWTRWINWEQHWPKRQETNVKQAVEYISLETWCMNHSRSLHSPDSLIHLLSPCRDDLTTTDLTSIWSTGIICSSDFSGSSWSVPCPLNKSRRSRVIDEWARCESGRMSQW